MTTLIATLVLLGVLILVHELGHYWAAKAVGVGVERFSIGLGPRLWGFTRKGTEYVLAVVPLGGYVKLQGMNDEVMEELEGGSSDVPRRPDSADFDSKPIWMRAFVISAGVIMNMLFALFVYFIINWTIGSTVPATTRVQVLQPERLPEGTEALAGLAPGATVVRIGDTEPENWMQVVQALAEAPPGPVEVAAEDPGAVVEIVIPADPEARNALAGSLQPWSAPLVGRVADRGPAESAGIRSGDLITRVAGAEVSSWAEMNREIRQRPGERVEVGLERDGAELVRFATLGEVPVASGGTAGQLGIFQQPFEAVPVPMGFREAAISGFDQTVTGTKLILNFLADLVTLDVSPREVGSIGTIAVVSGQAAEAGPATYLGFMAFFSINLAIFNLLPIPVLDGGHMVFLGIEAIRGRPLTGKQRLRWSQAGLFVILGIMAWALGNDALRLLGL